MKKQKLGLTFWLFVIALIFYINFAMGRKTNIEEIPYSKFKQLLKLGKIVSVEIIPGEFIKGVYFSQGEKREFKTSYIDDPNLLEEMEKQGVNYTAKTGGRWIRDLILSFGPFVLIILAWLFLLSRANGGARQIFSFGKARAQMPTQTKTTFDDVAGYEEVKEELIEIIKFLKDPQKFSRLGAKIPKGVLLYGPPGSGKTLLARAVAGEAGVPFFSASGSEFVEMFVGVGAARIRDLFQLAKKRAPAVVFIDEIDAVGRHRGAGLGGGHDEREQTLNQLLVEMDGFDPNTNIVIISATNRPDILDPALLRPGRFDRHIYVPAPNLKEREEILKVHAKKVKMAPEVDLKVIARRTPGFVGSDLANIINEAALLAARKDKEVVEMQDLEEAIDRVIAGPEKKSRVIQSKEKEIVSWHESGHALVAKFLPGGDPVHRVSIIPRGPALGYTLQLPLEDKHITSKEELLNKIKVLLGGRVAEKIAFNDYSTGAQNDLEKATEIAYKMVTKYGMSQRIGPAVFSETSEDVFLGLEIAKKTRVSEKMKQTIDEEVRNIIQKAERETLELLEKNKEILKKLAEELKKREVLDGNEIDKIIKGEELPPLEPEKDYNPPTTRSSKPEKEGETHAEEENNSGNPTNS
ncbi:MAG: ATP-dependent zinc metalloprotease FtsH [Elusimicrobia bacterium]|nr:ATP-dependent zinc metalloprotease FtsH [Elusimicrobiota bacterium]